MTYGKQGELQIGEFLDWVANGDGRVEVKRKRYLDHKIYVETHADKGAQGIFEPSGILVTTAACWCVVIDDTGIHITIPTPLLRAALDDPSSRPATQQRGSCPTRGMLVDFCVLLYRLKQRRDKGSL